MSKSRRKFTDEFKTEVVGLCLAGDRSVGRQAIFEYIEVFYNRQRRHSSLGYLSPLQFEIKTADTIRLAA